MKRTHFSIILLAAAYTLAGCGNAKTEEDQADQVDLTEIVAVEDSREVSLVKAPLPCKKEELLTAWKKIPASEQEGGKPLCYKEHTPLYFISTDLDGDGTTEVLMRGEDSYAAIFSCKGDSLHLLTHVENSRMGLGITQEGCIIRSMNDRKGNAVTEFITLQDSRVAVAGRYIESFEIQNKKFESGGIHYQLLRDAEMQEVGKEEFLQAAPALDATYFDALEDWEDFRKP